MKGKKMTTKKQEMQITTLSEPMALGEVFMQSGMFTDIKTQAQAVVKILAGRELGLAPLESMTNIYIVNGKVALQSKIIGSLIKKSKKYDYTVDKLDEKECTISFFQTDAKGDKVLLGKSTFSFTDAAKAGLVNKEVWKNYPRNMLFARALSNGARWYTADVFCGYTPEEAEEETKPVTKMITISAEGDVVSDDKTSETPVPE
jgi:hypothetical protein